MLSGQKSEFIKADKNAKSHRLKLLTSVYPFPTSNLQPLPSRGSDSALLLNRRLAWCSVKKNMAVSSQGPWWLTRTRRSSKLGLISSPFATVCLTITTNDDFASFSICEPHLPNTRVGLPQGRSGRAPPCWVVNQLCPTAERDWSKEERKEAVIFGQTGQSKHGKKSL